MRNEICLDAQGMHVWGIGFLRHVNALERILDVVGSYAIKVTVLKKDVDVFARNDRWNMPPQQAWGQNFDGYGAAVLAHMDMDYLSV